MHGYGEYSAGDYRSGRQIILIIRDDSDLGYHHIKWLEKESVTQNDLQTRTRITNKPEIQVNPHFSKLTRVLEIFLEGGWDWESVASSSERPLSSWKVEALEAEKRNHLSSSLSKAQVLSQAHSMSWSWSRDHFSRNDFKLWPTF